MAKNITMRVKDNKLTIEVDLTKTFGTYPSMPLVHRRGKNTIIATTSGNVDVDGTDDVKISLNVYKKA